TVHKTATLRLNAGGEDEFTGAQLGILLKNLTTNNHENGLMGGAWFCVDTANATAPVELAENFTDSGGAGGGAITFKKSGTGTLQLTGANSYSGRTYIEGGALSVASFNRIENRKPSSSLGAPTTLEDGMIDLSGDCVLIYVGSGETTDRIIDLNGNKQTVTVAQSGNGLLKFTSPFDISGYGFDKTLVLTGSTSGTGEFASTISNPYDRASKAKTSITKMGTGTWFLSGANSFTGTTTLIEGTLALTNAQSLDSSAVVDISSGATLELDFKVTMTIHQLIVDGELQPAGIYGATTSPGFLKGTGVLKVASP
ncbi:MAG: autotransporter-associated beta strand protein, partial [Verrucomicrobiales bacterium]